MSILIIGPTEQQHIKIAIDAARANAVPVEIVKAVANDPDPSFELLLNERKAGVDFVRKRYPPQQVMLGSTRKGKIPGLEVMAMVIPAFGFSGFPLQRPGQVWNEEFEPGWFAINVVEMEP